MYDYFTARTRKSANGPHPRPLADRFWEKVHKRGPDDCWLWTASVAQGYGHMVDDGHDFNAHRVSWEMAHGDIAEDQHVCHSCDKRYPPGDITYRRCVNPAHLFLGTRSDNMRDMCSKQRDRAHTRQDSYARGDNHYLRLHPELVLRGDDHYLRKHPEVIRRGEHSPSARFSLVQAEEIRALYTTERGCCARLARQYGVTWRVIKLIVDGVSYRPES